MKKCSLIIISFVFMALAHLAGASQADDATITISGHTAGATPFHQQIDPGGQQYNRSEEHSVHDRSKAGLRHPATVRHLFQRLPREPGI